MPLRTQTILSRFRRTIFWGVMIQISIQSDIGTERRWDAVLNFIFVLQSLQALQPCMARMLKRGHMKKKFLGCLLERRESYSASGVPSFGELGYKYPYSQIQEQREGGMLSLISMNEAIRAVSVVYGLKEHLLCIIFSFKALKLLSRVWYRGEILKKIPWPPLKTQTILSGVPAFRELGHKYAQCQIQEQREGGMMSLILLFSFKAFKLLIGVWRAC